MNIFRKLKGISFTANIPRIQFSIMLFCIMSMFFYAKNLYGQCPKISLRDLPEQSLDVINGKSTLDYMGYAVTHLGDVNGDGRSDILVSANQVNGQEAENSGEAYVIFGGEGLSEGFELNNLDGTNGFTIKGESGIRLGISASAAGDINGDGYNDIIIGEIGGFYVLFGAQSFPSEINATEINRTIGFKITTNIGINLSTFGLSVSGGGDFNGDGYDDIAIHTYNTSSYRPTGSITYLIFGSEGPFSDTFDVSEESCLKIEGGTLTEVSGGKIAFAGDINNDGFNDIIIGTPHTSYQESAVGKAFIVFGTSNISTDLDLSSLINGINGFEIIGEEENGQLGSSVSKAGDFNNDGIDDLIVGAPNCSGDESNREGRSYIIYGATGIFPEQITLAELDVNQGLKIIGDKYYARTGTQVGHAGDFNNDGIGDVIISGTTDRGTIYVLYGNEEFTEESFNLNNLNGNNGFLIKGNKAGETFGHSTSTAGDFNGDGKDDLLIGSIPSSAYSNSTRALLIYSDPSEFEDKEPPSFTRCNNYTVAKGTTLPDYRTLIGFSENCGEVAEVIQTPERGTLISADTEVTATAKDLSGNIAECKFNVSVANIRERKCPGALKMSELDEHVSYTLSGPFAEAPHQSSVVSYMGDINHDGIDDIGITINDVNSDNSRFPDRIHIIYGSDQPLPPASDLYFWEPSQGVKILAPNPDVQLNNIQNLGDVNNDGYDDLMVFSSSKLYVIFGRPDGLPDEIELVDNNENIGMVIPNLSGKASPACDVNGDGINDIVLSSEKKAYVIYGTSNLPSSFNMSSLDGINGFTINGTVNISSITAEGDINNDGYGDIIIGTPGANFNNEVPSPGQVYVVYGSRSSPSTVLEVSELSMEDGFKIDGIEEGRIGHSVCSGLDLNQDGLVDFVISAPSASPEGSFKNGAGKAYVIFGKTSNYDFSYDLKELNGENGFTILGEAFIGQMGSSLSKAGDFNNDGIDDLILGAPYDARGNVYVLYGNTSWEKEFDLEALNGVNGLHIINQQDLPRSIGSFISNAGDFNADGIDDIIISSHPSFGTNVWGSSHIIFGHGQLDTEAPKIVCPDDQKLVLEEELPNYIDLSEASDNCGKNLAISQTPLPDITFTNDTTVTLTVTDISGNSNTCTFRVIEEVIALKIECPDDQQLECNISELPDFTEMATVTGDGEITLTQEPQAGEEVIDGMTVTINAENEEATTSCSFKIHVLEPKEPPVLNCLEDQKLELNQEIPDYTSITTATDYCGNEVEISQEPEAGTLFSGNTTTVTLTATDKAGNFTTCTFTIIEGAATIKITCPDDQQLECDIAELPDFTEMATVTGDGEITLTQQPKAGEEITDGMTVTITAENEEGSAFCSFKVTLLKPEEPPVLNCLENQKLRMNEEIPDYTSMASATDQCGNEIEVTQEPEAGTIFTGNTTVTLTATDRVENSTTCSFLITEEITPPQITCPGEQRVECEVSELPDFTEIATASGTGDIAISQYPEAGTSFEDGMTVNLIAENEHGTDECAFKVFYKKAVLTCPGNQYLDITTNCKAILPDFSDLVEITRGCDSEFTLSQTPEAGYQISSPTAVTINLTTATGNSATCTFNAIVKDHETPSVTTGPDVLIVLGESHTLEANASAAGTFIWEPSTGLNYNDIKYPEASPEVTTIYTVTFKDEVGCTAQDNVEVKVVDILIPKGFSPDSDGINDEWIIRGIERYPNNEIAVFNRWGDLVFTASGYNNNNKVFAGEANKLNHLGASKLPEGTYFYSIILEQGSEPIKGFLVLKK